MSIIEKILITLAFYCASMVTNLVIYTVLGETAASAFFGVSIVGALGFTFMRLGRKMTTK